MIKVCYLLLKELITQNNLIILLVRTFNLIKKLLMILIIEIRLFRIVILLENLTNKFLFIKMFLLFRIILLELYKNL